MGVHSFQVCFITFLAIIIPQINETGPFLLRHVSRCWNSIFIIRRDNVQTIRFPCVSFEWVLCEWPFKMGSCSYLVGFMYFDRDIDSPS